LSVFQGLKRLKPLPDGLSLSHGWPERIFKMTHRIERGLLLNMFVTILAGLLLIFAPGAWGSEETKKKEIRVFTERQVLVASENGEEIFSFDIVTGRGEKETTAGRFKIFRKHEKYTSKTYGSEMPYTMFFTKDGKAIHGTTMATLRSYLHSYLTESVGSEGCVGLTDDNAKALFDWAPVGTPVIVISKEE
jgi:lipoprotein-anchoring transpeptidase ErfK/SrfK